MESQASSQNITGLVGHWSHEVLVQIGNFAYTNELFRRFLQVPHRVGTPCIYTMIKFRNSCACGEKTKLLSKLSIGSVFFNKVSFIFSCEYFHFKPCFKRVTNRWSSFVRRNQCLSSLFLLIFLYITGTSLSIKPERNLILH